MYALLVAVLEAMAGFFRWKATESELRSRTLLYDTQRKIEQEIMEARRDYARLWNSGYHDAAIELRELITKRTLYLSSLPAIDDSSPQGGIVTDTEGSVHPAS